MFPAVAVAILVASVIIGMNLISEPVIRPSFSDDNVVSLERTACFGFCPVYSVTVFKSGEVIFEGKQYVENIGVFKYRISTNDAEKIFEKFYEINFFALDDKYTINATDLPTAITTFKNDSYEKTVSNYGNSGPAKLEELEMLIDKIANTSQMIKNKIPAPTKKIASVFEMKPNSSEYFYYPNPEKTQNRDVFQKFILIRLPEEWGGGAQDASAFRAYSAVSLSDHCMVKYWPQEGRKNIMNPCFGDVYRVIDGLVIMSIDKIRIPDPMTLPSLDLSIDKDGFLYVEPPKFTPYENGVVGEGRHISLPEIRKGSQKIADGFVETNPDFPKIPVDFAGKILTEIDTQNHDIEARYMDFASMSGFTTIRIQHIATHQSDYAVNLEKSNSEFWQIGNHVITTDEYGTHFFKDKFNFEVKGENQDYIRKEVVRKFFPEYIVDDMFLISKTG